MNGVISTPDIGIIGNAADVDGQKDFSLRLA